MSQMPTVAGVRDQVVRTLRTRTAGDQAASGLFCSRCAFSTTFTTSSLYCPECEANERVQHPLRYEPSGRSRKVPARELF